FSWRANGKLVIYRNDKNFRHAAEKITESASQQVLDAKGCVAAEPALAHLARQLQGGIFSAGDEVGDCQLFCQQLLARLQQNPNFSRPAGQRLTGLIKAPSRVRALQLENSLSQGRQAQGSQAQAREFAVDQLVVAAGMGSRRLLNNIGIKVPLYPLTGYSLTL